MGLRKWKTYNCFFQKISMLFGFLLIWGLSSEGTWTSYFVVLLILNFFMAEIIWIKKIKGLYTVHYLETYWLLLAAAIAYIWTNNIVVKIFMLLVILLASYVTFYRECYYEKVTFHYLKYILGDFPILCLYYVIDFFKKDELLKNRIRRYKCINGFCILFIVLMGIFLPLYSTVDNSVKSILYFVIIKLFSLLPIWVICALIGLIPAMINYSIVRGLTCDIVLKNPERNNMSSKHVNSNSVFLDKVVVKIIICGLLIVNIFFIVLQLSYLFNIQESQKNIESLYYMSNVFLLLMAIGISIFFVIISEYLIINRKSKYELLWITYLYILSLIALLLLTGYRYALKVMYYGIGNLDMLVIISIALFTIIIAIVLYSIFVNKKNILNMLALWGTVGFVILSILPWEYFASQINVSVFIRRYQNGEFVDKVTEQDINIDFLKQMKFDAVPALISLFDVTLLYEDTDKSLGENVKESIIQLFCMDMTDEEISYIGELETDKEIEYFKNIVGEKVEYRIIGKRKIVYEIFCDALERN